jgi:hypothetical protein
MGLHEYRILSTRRGITVAEVTVAIFVLLIAILGLIAAMTRLAVSQGVSSHQSVAYLVADKVLKNADSTGPPEWGLPVDEAQRYQEMAVGQTGRLEQFRYSLTAVPVPEPTGPDAVFEAGADMGDLYLVEVTVWWGADESGPQGRQQQGERRVKLGKLVYAQR